MLMLGDGPQLVKHEGARTTAGIQATVSAAGRLPGWGRRRERAGCVRVRWIWRSSW